MSEWKDELNTESDDLKDLETLEATKPTTEGTNETVEDSSEVDKVKSPVKNTFRYSLNSIILYIGIRSYETKSEGYGG